MRNLPSVVTKVEYLGVLTLSRGMCRATVDTGMNAAAITAALRANPEGNNRTIAAQPTMTPDC